MDNIRTSRSSIGAIGEVFGNSPLCLGTLPRTAPRQSWGLCRRRGFAFDQTSHPPIICLTAFTSAATSAVSEGTRTLRVETSPSFRRLPGDWLSYLASYLSYFYPHSSRATRKLSTGLQSSGGARVRLRASHTWTKQVQRLLQVLA